LHTLCLAENDLLCAKAILSCVASLSPETLRVLDLSGTQADSNVCDHLLSSQKKLTHLRMGCRELGLVDASHLNKWLGGFPNLEVLDIAGCYLHDCDTGLACSAPNLRFIAVGLSAAIGQEGELEAIRNAFARCVPHAHVIGGSLDLFNGYKELPPTLR
jgi:hypothetical protein